MKQSLSCPSKEVTQHIANVLNVQSDKIRRLVCDFNVKWTVAVRFLRQLAHKSPQMTVQDLQQNMLAAATEVTNPY